MKTRNLIFTILALFIAAISFATDAPKMNVTTANEGRLKVSFQSATAMPLEFVISDQEGVILYSWKSKAPETELNKVYDISEFEDGTFNFAISYGEKSIKYDIIVNQGKILVGSAHECPEPYFSFRDNKLNISFLNESCKTVYLNVYKNGEHYDGFVFGKDLVIQKAVDFKQAENGEYMVVLTDKYKDHYFTVTK